MIQYCRYCAYMCCGNGNYCEVNDRCYSDSTIISTNHCKSFEFNPIDALDLDKRYKPREKKETNTNQITIEEILRDDSIR